MEALVFLIPAALFLGFVGLCAFLWALHSGQFEDLDGAAMRILNDDVTEQNSSASTPPQSGADSEKN